MLRNVSTAVIQPNWLNTVEGDTVIKQLLDPSTSKRRIFGILEKPDIPPNYEEVSYKLFFIGKSATDKSKVIAELAGESINTHQDSHGIHKTNVYWPTKIWDKIILFRLLCWEAGDSGLKKFSHILPACLDRSDALVFVFSFEDGHSLLEISQNIVKLKTKESNQPALIVIGTRYSTSKNMAISFADVKEFESKWHLNVLKIPPLNGNISEAMRAAATLNSICELLWLRDQEYILKQSFDNFALKE